ncbi:hypothetical protein Agub_g7465, partial [Astrephomene gubernaculifera]
PHVLLAQQLGLALPGPAAGGGGGGIGANAGPSSPSPSSWGGRREPHLNFITQLTALQVLTIEPLSTRGLVFSCLGQLRALRALRLGGCIELSQEGLERVKRASLPQLRSLRMMGCQWGSVEPWSLLQSLPLLSPRLEQLELGAAPRLTAARLAGALRGLPGLRQVRLHGPDMSQQEAMQEPGLVSGDLRFLSCVAPSPASSAPTSP